jgi:hypothetical protein
VIAREPRAERQGKPVGRYHHGVSHLTNPFHEIRDQPVKILHLMLRSAHLCSFFGRCHWRWLAPAIVS